MSSLPNYRIYGDSGPAVYILHGIFGMLDNWHYAAGILSKTCRVITFDARNHGCSFHDDDASFEAMSEDLRHLMQHLGDDNAIVIGHSMGGKTAMLFAERYPEIAKGLIVVDIAPKAYPAGHGDYFKAFCEIDFETVQSRKEAETLFEPYAPDASVRQFLLKNLEPITGGGYQLKINIDALEKHYPDIIGDLHLSRGYAEPTLFIRGEKSGYIKDSDMNNILNFFPNAELKTIPAAGHWVHADNPAEFISTISDFIVAHSQV
ncbi:MAG: alpha/beta fold hydrolase [Sphingomonadales bacterium]